MPDTDRIRPWAGNPRYWQLEGRPMLLLGGSREDNLFQIPDLDEHLDLLASVGGNYVRNTMSDRDEGNVYPYLRLADGRYDLDRWNEEYWDRFARLLRGTGQRGIVVQLEIWDRFDLTDAKGTGHWQRHPYRPANNVNYTSDETDLADAYPDHPAGDRHPFFHTVPGMRKYRPVYDRLRPYQERFVTKVLAHSLPYGHVLYCVDNETSTEPAWGLYWRDFIKRQAAASGVEVCVTDMFDDGWKPEESANIGLQLAHPELYDFIDISQVNSRNFGEEHWRRLLWVSERLQAHPRPLNHTKIYSAGRTAFGSGTPQDGIERFWRNLLGGSAAVRFHRPPSGIGLNEQAQACLRAARRAAGQVAFWHLRPHQELLVDRSPNAAYLAAAPGTAYVLFLCDGGRVTLDLAGAAGPFDLRWIDVGDGDWGPQAVVRGDQRLPLAAPSSGPWAATLQRRQG